MSLFERALRGLMGAPVVRRAPAADSLSVFRQVDAPPPPVLRQDGNLVQQEWLAPSLGVRAMGLPENRMPDFGPVTLYFDPEVLNNSRLYSADVWSPRGSQIAPLVEDRLNMQSLGLFGMPEATLEQRREAAANVMMNTTMRNAESPISVEGDRLAAGLATEFRTPDQMATSLRGGRIVTDRTDTDRPFRDFDRVRETLYPTGQVAFTARRDFNRRVHDALDTGGRSFGQQRDAIDAPERTLQAILHGLDPTRRSILEPWMRANAEAPVRYAEAKYMGYLSPDSIVAMTAANPSSFNVRRIQNGLSNPVPVARALGDLPPNVLRRVLWGGGGVAPWMTLGGEDE